MTDRCNNCGDPRATQALFDAHDEGCDCEECGVACWAEFGYPCEPPDVAELRAERDDALVSVTLLASDTAPDNWTRLSASSFVRHATEGDPPNFRCARFWLDAPRGVWLWSVGWRSPAGVLTVGESATPVGAMRAADDASLDAEQRYGPPGNYACEHENDTSPCSGRMEWHYWPCPVLNRAEAVSLCRKHHMQWHREEDEIVHHDPDPALDASKTLEVKG